MQELVKAKEPFKFSTRLHLTELTGLKANDLADLRNHIKDVPGSCIYHHTHKFLQHHQYLSPEPPNDFAYWVSEMLREEELGERLASIDIVRFSRIVDLRQEIIKTIDDYLESNPSAKSKLADEGEEFNFMKSISFVFQTNYSAADLAEFAEILKKITANSIYFHIFEARLRLEKGDNDFSNWIEDSVGDKKLADEITMLDPYTHTLEELRGSIVEIIENKIKNHG